MIKDGEIIIININAKMRLGKSTLAMGIGEYIFGLLQKYKKQPKSAKFTLQNIARDDQEFSKRMRDVTLQNTVMVTDESNELEQTGENVTVEQALKKVFSDVQAGRYVHRVCCSPKEMVDENADILLSVIAIDRKACITRSKLYYRFYEGGQQHTQLLGYVDIPVGHIIKEWLPIKDIFLKPHKTEEEKQRIKDAQKHNYYVEYMIKKYEKMELITKEGIFKPRILDYAHIILAVVKELVPLTRLTNIINANIIRNYIKIHFRRAKIPTSIVGEELATREVQGLLDVYKAYWQVSKQITDSDKKIKELAIKGKQSSELTDREKQLVELRGTLLTTITFQEEELMHYAEINRKYHEGGYTNEHT
jgi:hypothetical protein